MLDRPLGVYINWSSYDELSDAVELTEGIAMRQFEHLVRLRRLGVQLDCYLMDCFWHAPDGGWRIWRKPHWRDDGERWLAACREHGVLPGLWFGCNSLGASRMLVVDAWRGSLDANDPNHRQACLFAGGYLADFMAAMDHWYRRGVRVFKLDFLDLGACLPEHRLSLLPSEIRARNADAFRTALTTFRREHREAIVVGYNGFEEHGIQGGTDFTPVKTMDHRWLEGLDAFYSGDPRPADIPAMTFWRAKDVYSDHLVRAYLAQGIDHRRIDNAGFMIGTTGTCYGRGATAWRGMLLLSLARGGWLNTYYGNLDLLDDAAARWFAKAQALFLPLQRHGDFSVFGALPGTGAAYGFLLADGRGALIAVVNSGQAVATLTVPGLASGRVLFRDAGFVPVIADGAITLGPEQMALIGIGAFADAGNDLGVQDDVRIPLRSEPIALQASVDGRHRIAFSVPAPASGSLRLAMRQRGGDGKAKRTSGGSPPKGRTLGTLLTITASQGGAPVAIDIAYDKAIWSGLSWAIGEIPASRLKPGIAVDVRMASQEDQPVVVTAEAWRVVYD